MAMIRPVLAFLALLLLGGPLFAAELKWLTDYPKALARAKAEGRLVLLNFTGSDFCIACKQLKAEVFPQKEFTDFAQRRLVLVELDFPLKKKQPDELKQANAALKEQFKVTGYPTLILVDAAGKKLGEADFDQDAKGLVKELETLAAKAGR